MSGAFTGLTSTEKEIVGEYLKGSMPAEISRKMGVSIRTVYKALYKYRRNLRKMGLHDEAEKLKVRTRKRKINIEQQKKAYLAQKSIELEQSSSVQNILPVTSNLDEMLSKAVYTAVYDIVKELLMNSRNRSSENLDNAIVAVLKEISEEIRGIKSILMDLSKKININIEDFTKSASVNVNEDLSFLNDNPWLEVLRTRGKD